MKPLLTAVAATALGAGGYATYHALRPKLVMGPPTVPSSDELVTARKVGNTRPVVGGALAWSDEFDEIARQDGANYVRTLSGRRVSTSSPAAGYALYDIVCELGLRANELEQLFYRTLDESTARRFYGSYLSGGTYDLSVLSGISRNILVSLIGAWTCVSNALRILGRLYQANNMRPQDRPARWRARGIDLSRIVVLGGIAHPMAIHANPNTPPGSSVREIAFPGEWRSYGVELIDRLRAAYPEIVAIPDDDGPALEESLEYDRNMTVGQVDSQSTMGAIIAPIAAWIGAHLIRIGWTIAIIIVAYGAARAINKLASGATAWLGANVEYLETKLDAYREALDDCADAGLPQAEREIACQRAETLALEIEAYKPGLAGMWVALLVVGGLGVGSYVLWKLSNRKRPLIKKRKKNPVQLPIPQPPVNYERAADAATH